MLRSKLAIPVILISVVIASAMVALRVVVIPAYVGTILPFRLSSSRVETPSFDVTPFGSANIVLPAATGWVNPVPTLIVNELSPSFCLTIKSPSK